MMAVQTATQQKKKVQFTTITVTAKGREVTKTQDPAKSNLKHDHKTEKAVPAVLPGKGFRRYSAKQTDIVPLQAPSVASETRKGNSRRGSKYELGKATTLTQALPNPDIAGELVAEYYQGIGRQDEFGAKYRPCQPAPLYDYEGDNVEYPPADPAEFVIRGFAVPETAKESMVSRPELKKSSSITFDDVYPNELPVIQPFVKNAYVKLPANSSLDKFIMVPGAKDRAMYCAKEGYPDESPAVVSTHIAHEEEPLRPHRRRASSTLRAIASQCLSPINRFLPSSWKARPSTQNEADYDKEVRRNVTQAVSDGKLSAADARKLSFRFWADDATIIEDQLTRKAVELFESSGNDWAVPLKPEPGCKHYYRRSKLYQTAVIKADIRRGSPMALAALAAIRKEERIMQERRIMEAAVHDDMMREVLDWEANVYWQRVGLTDYH